MHIAPAVRDYAVFGHRSQEGGHPLLLAHLKATPLLQLDLRLGEGSGAVLSFPLLQAACGFLNEMASFESAAVSDKGGDRLATAPPCAERPTVSCCRCSSSPGCRSRPGCPTPRTS